LEERTRRALDRHVRRKVRLAFGGLRRTLGHPE
jgi:hypothetical protein